MLTLLDIFLVLCTAPVTMGATEVEIKCAARLPGLPSVEISANGAGAGKAGRNRDQRKSSTNEFVATTAGLPRRESC